MNRFIILILAVLFSLTKANAQAVVEDPESTQVLLRNEYFFGGFISTSGWGIEFKRGFNKTFTTKWMYEANLIELKADKETRVYNPLYRNSRSYFYGKLNTLYSLRVGGGQQKMLNRKPYWGGVEVRYFWFAGGSLGMAKPVYLYIVEDLIYTPIYIRVLTSLERYDPNRHFPDNIYGRGPFTEGFGEFSFHPGAYAKAGFSFDYSTRNQVVTSLELGVALDVFPAGVPVMAFNEKEYYFLSFYFGFYFGKRFN